MKNRIIISLWGILLVVMIFTWPITVWLTWLITGFDLPKYLIKKINGV